MLNAALPLRFQLRVQVQALVNALRRPTSDASKLLRLSCGALETLDQSDVREAELRQSLMRLCADLKAGQAVDRLQRAALLDRAAAAVHWTRADFRPAQPLPAH